VTVNGRNWPVGGIHCANLNGCNPSVADARASQLVDRSWPYLAICDPQFAIRRAKIGTGSTFDSGTVRNAKCQPLMSRAGLPTTLAPAGTSCVTTLPAPIEERFMCPPGDAPIVARCALRLDRAPRAGRRPVPVQGQTTFDGRHPPDRPFPSGATVLIVRGDVDEVLLVENGRPPSCWRLAFWARSG
jgi:hypothetical protein